MANLWEHIDLCSGIGGFSLGFQYAKLSEPILFCELDDYCQKVLKKHWPDVKICNDVKELADDTTKFIPRRNGRKRILTAGYPCQPFSQAGQRRGTEDPRHIWPYILRIIQQERPDVCVFENVAGHISLGLDEVLHDLQGANYQTRVYNLPAEACGAPHVRSRIWIIGRNVDDSNNDKCNEPGGAIPSEEEGNKEQKWTQDSSTGNTSGASELRISNQGHDDVSNANSIRRDEERYENGNTQKDSNQKTEGGEYQRGSSYVANPNGERLQGSEETRNIGEGRTDSSKFSTRHGGESNVAYPNSEGLEGAIRESVQRDSNGFTNEDKDVPNANNDGQQRRQLETRDQTIARQDTQSIRATNSDKSIRYSDDGRDFEKSRTDEDISGLPNDGATKPSTSERFRGVSEIADEHQGVGSQDRHKENDNRTLVQEGQSRVQSSLNRGLGENQASFERDQIRPRDDNYSEQGMAEQGDDVANPNSQRGCSRSSGNEDAKDVGQSSRSEKYGGRNTKRRLGGMVDGLSPWLDEPLDIPRVATGQKNRTHRLKALGNAIIPQIAQRIGIAIKESF